MGSIRSLPDFTPPVGVWEVRRRHIGFVAPLRFKRLDVQPKKSNVGPVSTDLHDLHVVARSCNCFESWYLLRIRPGRRNTYV